MIDVISPSFVKRLISSRYFFIVFLAAPLALLAQRLLHLPLLNPLVVILNNLLFALCLCVVVASRLRMLGRVIRYGEKGKQWGRAVEVSARGDAVRERLCALGYVFTTAGNYGERRDLGYAGGTLALAGLALLLLFGSYDNLRQFSGIMLFGVGQPAKLYERGAFLNLNAGVLAFPEKVPYQLQIRKQFPLSAERPQGGSEVAVLDREGNEIKSGILVPGKGLVVGNLDLFMTKLVSEAWLVVTTTENMDLLSEWVKLYPDPNAPAGYTHSGSFADPFMKSEGTVWFDPATERIRVVAKREGRQVLDVVLEKDAAYKKEQGGYRAAINGIGKWSEIHVTRKRHKGLLLFAALLFVAGGALRLAIRPRRVWIEEKGDMCIVRGTDKEALSVVSGVSDGTA